MRDITNKILNQNENPKIKLIEEIKEINEIKTKSIENEEEKIEKK